MWEALPRSCPALPIQPRRGLPSAQCGLCHSPASPDHLLLILPHWLTHHLLGEAPLHPRVPPHSPGFPRHCSHCCYLFGSISSLDPALPEGLHLVRPGGGTALSTPRHRRDFWQSGSANEHPSWVLRRGGGRGESRRKKSFAGLSVRASVFPFALFRHTLLCLYFPRPDPGQVLMPLLFSDAASAFWKKQTSFSASRHALWPAPHGPARPC